MRIHVIVLACIATLGVALLGQRFFYQQRVADPLQADAKAVPGVSAVDIRNSNGKQVIHIELAKDADLRSVYTQVHALGQRNLGASFGGVQVLDTRNKKLADSFYLMHFHVQQAISTGMFTEMAAGVDAIARQTGLQARVFVDSDNVYVQLADDEHRLYEVIARPPDARTQQIGGGTAT